jgi:8-oxo-dGTP pyrophosphatase MutT (NUDIX family)
MKHDGSGILFTTGQKVLLLKRAKGSDHAGTWGIPGGKAHEKETPIENASRESKEEAGLSEIPGEQISSIRTDEWVTFIFRVKKPFPVSVSDEHTDSKWFDLDNLTEVDLHPKFRENLPKYLRKIHLKFGKGFSEWISLENLFIRLHRQTSELQ